MTKKTPIQSDTKRGRKPRAQTDKKIKVQIYLKPDIIDFINGLIEEGEAYSIAAFVVLAVQKHVKAIKNAKLESTESQTENLKNSKKVEKS